MRIAWIQKIKYQVLTGPLKNQNEDAAAVLSKFKWIIIINNYDLIIWIEINTVDGTREIVSYSCGVGEKEVQ